MASKHLKGKKNIFLIALLVIFLLSIVVAFYRITNKVHKLAINPEEKIPQELDNSNMLEINEILNTAGDTISIEDLQQNEIVLATEIPENTTSPNKDTNKINTPPYYIKVNYGAQVVTVYKKDDNNNYTVPVKAMVCSTGVYTPTSGVYKIPARWEWLFLQGDVWGHYSTQIKGNILFHSVPYLEKGKLDSLEYWEYDKLGTYASAGCVRLTVQDAKWIFDNCKNGTQVEFYSSSNPGPLGKPSAKRISSYEDYLRNWDPTDPNPNNPWKSYKEPPKQDINLPDNTTDKNENIIDNSTSENETDSNTVDNSTSENEVDSNTVDNSISENEIDSNITDNSTVENEIDSNSIDNFTSKNEIISNNTDSILHKNI